MCGICGLVAHGDAGAARPAAERMSAALRHRGPDDAGLHADGPAVLAARRLAIIDLERGAQPALGEDGAVAVVQNGEIYNHAELRAELERAGHRFRSRHSDTEVLAHLYEEEGDAFVSRLRGMFAVAVWDARRRRLVLARDAFGIKPLLHARTPHGLAFASELTALRLAPGFDDGLDPDALDAYLAFNAIPAPLTIFRGARKLPPGHLLTWEDGEVEIRRWTRPRPADAGATRAEPLEALAAEARERLRDSVRAHLVSDVPVGVLLSGGVDSSALAALATAEGGPLSSFSVGFAEPTFDETPLARLVAGRLGTDHHELRISPGLAAETMPGLAQAFDEPFADSSALPTFLVSRLAAEHVKVVLSGEGGDELFGGYETYVAGLLAQRFGPLAARLRPLAERLPSRTTRVSLDYRAKRFTRAAALPPLERHHAFKEIFAPETRRALTGGAGADPVGLLRDRFAETAGAPLLGRLQDVDLGIYLPDDLLVKTDRMSMANSLEARVPFLDPAVAGLALALPTRLKVQGTRKKILLRAAVAPLVPAELLRAPKRGFSIPAAAWLRGPLLPLAREVLSPATLGAHGVIDAAVAGSVLERHATGTEDLSRQLWGLMSLSLWWERHGRAAAARVAA